MGSEVPGPGADAAGPAHVAAHAAHAWAIAAAHAAVTVPIAAAESTADAEGPGGAEPTADAEGTADAEAAAWTVRGWADVAVGCIALDRHLGPLDPLGSRGPDPVSAFGGLDQVVRAVPVAAGGQHAARLRQLRELAGPVPPWYPDTRPMAGPIRAVGRLTWQAADLLARFGRDLMAVGAGLPWPASCPLSSASQLAWGARYRPGARYGPGARYRPGARYGPDAHYRPDARYRPPPGNAHRTVRLPVSRRLARRTWMCLPGPHGPGPAVAEVPSAASPLAQQIWRGIHEGAHLDHLGVLTALRPAAPSPAEFGSGLLVAESYAMAVEIVAAVECVLAGEGHAVWQLGAGLIERATRLPGGSEPAPEFADLPTLAEVYVLGPLEVLAGGGAVGGAAVGATAAGGGAAGGGAAGGPSARGLAVRELLPSEVTGPLHARWRAACAAYPPAAAFGYAAADLAARLPPV